MNIHEWQSEEIRKGISEANKEEFTAHDELVTRWEQKRVNSLDDRTGFFHSAMKWIV